MSDPYAAPRGGSDRAIGDVEFADELAFMVREFRIWHTGIGGIGVFFCGLMLLFSLFMGFTGLMAGGGEAAMMAVLGGVYAFMALIYGIPAVLLLRSGIAAMRVFSGAEDREPILQSIRMQLWLWRVIGITMMSLTLLYVLLFAVALVAGMMSVL